MPQTALTLWIANHVLFYCDDIAKVCREVSRILVPGGRFLCSTYGASHMQEITALVQEFDSRIQLSGDALYARFGLENGAEILAPYFRIFQRGSMTMPYMSRMRHH